MSQDQAESYRILAWEKTNGKPFDAALEGLPETGWPEGVYELEFIAEAKGDKASLGPMEKEFLASVDLPKEEDQT